MPKTLLHRTHPPTLLLTRLLNSTKQVQRYFLTKRAFVSRSLTRRRERVGVRVFVTKIGLDTSPHLRPSLRPACGKGEKDTTCQTTFSAMLSSVRQESQSDKDKTVHLKLSKEIMEPYKRSCYIQYLFTTSEWKPMHLSVANLCLHRL